MKYSIKKKFALLILLTTTIISACIITTSTIVVRQLANTMYKESADNASYVAAANVDPGEVKILRDKVLDIYNSSEKITSSQWGSEEFEKYQALYEALYDTQEYQNVLRDLRVVQDGSKVDCIYIFYPVFSEERNDYIYLADADHDEPCPIGGIDSYDWADESAEKLIEHPEIGLDPY